MSNPEIKSFEEFWPHYVLQHANKTNRRLHFIGTTAGMVLVGAGVLTRRLSLIALGPAVGYGFAWIGHFFVEGNIPASFGHPLWSFKADFVMWKKILEGTMDAEVERVQRETANASVQEDVQPNTPASPTIN